jgi:prepilin-type processing-associated H-X9-DG protein
VTVVLIVAVAGGALAAERPLAALVPADVSTYSEWNLDRMLGRAPETAAIGQAFAQMKSPATIRQMWAELSAGDKDMAKVNEALAILKGASESIGPRLAYATWIPDAQSLMGGMMGGAGGGAQGAKSMMPKVLLVADLRDAAKFDALISQIATEANLDVRVTEGAGTKTMSFANGMVELVRGDDWMALGFPPESARKAADRAAGTTSESLVSDPSYQSVIGRLPADAVLTEYVSAASLRQLIALANIMAPAAGLSYSSDEPLGWASGVRVEEVQGRQMVTTYSMTDMAFVNLLDAWLIVDVTALKPMIEKQKAQGKADAQADECLSQMETLAGFMQAYLADHDNTFPAANRWVEELKPYVEDPKTYKCPEDKSDGFSSYGMNSALSGKSLDDLEDPGSVVLFYETAHPGANPSGGKDDVVSPPRHRRGNNFAYADGAVEWIAPDAEEQPSFDVGPSGEET